MPSEFEIKKILTSKASKSICHFKVAALGIDHKNQFLGCTFNVPRFSRRGGGIHAEMQLMKKFNKRLKKILILRLGQSGDILPINPCNVCSTKAKELGIKIQSIK